jgi:LytS/YehU family sensor histidine kinase
VLPAFREGWLGIWAVGATTFFCMVLLISALDAADQGEAAARRALESEVASRDAELRALRAQVDPHFLFNCLHSISSLTSRSAEGARQMCLELADFFRASLRAGAEQRITLGSELQLLRNYLNIEQVRFGDRLRAHVDDPGEANDVMVPPLLLQPLVENAVRHGIATLIDRRRESVRSRWASIGNRGGLDQRARSAGRSISRGGADPRRHDH